MLIVVILGRWPVDSVRSVVHGVWLYNVLDTVVISGEDVCCSVVGVSVLSVIWSELLITSVEFAFTTPVKTECGVFVAIVMCLVLFICTFFI